MDLTKLKVKSDRRGSLVEAFKLPKDGQIFYVIIKAGESRGNHYHQHKTETFLVIYGSAEITVKNRDTNDMMKVETSGNKPMKVKIMPNHTHSITATDEGCILIVWVDKVFNKKDPDTYMEEI